MYYSKKSIAQFLEGSKTLIFAVKDDGFIKERIKTYNYDAALCPKPGKGNAV